MGAHRTAPAADQPPSMSIWAVIALGVGSMVGAGIFALLGQTALAVGKDAWLAFAIGGAIAMLSGLSYAALSAKYPTNGGIVDFFDLALPKGLASGLSLLYVLNLAIATAMIAKTFGAYGAKLFGFPAGHPANLVGSLALILLYLVTSAGRQAVGRLEVVLVGIKLLILLTFMTGGLWLIDLRIHASHVGSTPDALIASVGLTFFAYAGFGMMANAAGNVADPARTMRRAFPAAIAFTTALYVGLAFVVLAAIPPDALARSAETAVAAAAEPYFGRAGFVILSIAALLATASTINANIYSANEMARSLVAAGQLPRHLGAPLLGSGTRGLFYGICLVLLLVNVFDISSVANAAGAIFLIVYLAVFVVAWRMRPETGAAAWPIILGSISMAGVLATFFWSLWSTQPVSLAIIAAAVLVVLFVQVAARALHRGQT